MTVPGRKRIAGLVVILATAVLVPVTDVTAGEGVVDARVAHHSTVTQKGPQNLLRALVRLTRRATVKGRRILTSDEAKTARQIGNQIRKATNFYCGQWVDYFKSYPYRAKDTDAAVFVWWFAATTHPETQAGRAYGYCKRLFYWAIVLYEPT